MHLHGLTHRTIQRWTLWNSKSEWTVPTDRNLFMRPHSMLYHRDSKDLLGALWSSTTIGSPPGKTKPEKLFVYFSFVWEFFWFFQISLSLALSRFPKGHPTQSMINDREEGVHILCIIINQIPSKQLIISKFYLSLLLIRFGCDCSLRVAGAALSGIVWHRWISSLKPWYWHSWEHRISG